MIYEEFKKKIKITNPIGNREYGMRDFDIEDNSGYWISFGQGFKS